MASEETVVEQADDSNLPDDARFSPSPQVVARAEEARKELDARGANVWVEKKWWGFEVHLAAQASQTASTISDLIGDIAASALPSPYGKIVEAYCKLKAVWIKEVGKDYGCKLVSPWIAPGMLIPIAKKPTEDTSLWWTVLTPAQGWNEDQKFTAHHSGSNPALAAYNGKLYLVHRGYGAGDDQLWWAVYDPDNGGWSEDRKFPGHSSGAGPALAVFGGKLNCVHRGAGSDTRLWHTTFSGTSWSTDTPMDAHHSSVGPALAEYNGKLHLVHRAADSGQLWHATYDGTRWSTDTELPAHSTASNPALAVFNNKLHLVHRGSDNVALWHATYDGTRWSADTKMPAHNSLEGPSLAVFDSKLYCVHRGYGGGDQHLWWAVYDPDNDPDKRWSEDWKFPGHTSGAGPAVIAYRDKYGAENQLLVVHRGYGLRSAGTDAAEVEARIAEEEHAAGTADSL